MSNEPNDRLVWIAKISVSREMVAAGFDLTADDIWDMVNRNSRGTGFEGDDYECELLEYPPEHVIEELQGDEDQ